MKLERFSLDGFEKFELTRIEKKNVLGGTFGNADPDKKTPPPPPPSNGRGLDDDGDPNGDPIIIIPFPKP